MHTFPRQISQRTLMLPGELLHAPRGPTLVIELCDSNPIKPMEWYIDNEMPFSFLDF
jgi:hypothetical protein